MSVGFSVSDASAEILNFFTDNFSHMVSYMGEANKEELCDIAPLLFKKWYHCTLVQDTVLSVRNVLEMEWNKALPKGCVNAVTLHVTQRGDKERQYLFYQYSYSPDSHPIVDDLKALLEYCSPARDIRDDMCLKEEDSRELSAFLSQQDMYYIEYLMILSYRLDLLQPLTAIHSKKVQPSEKAYEFMNKPHKEILACFIQESVALCAEKLNALLHDGLDNSCIEPKMILSFLKTPVPTDEILEKIYQTIGFDIERVWEASESESLSEFELSLLSSTFFIGALLDKWFVSVFGYYLHIIKPFYFTAFDFRESINALNEILIMKKDIGLELFSPCSFYSLTPLGKALIKGCSRKKDTLQSISPHFTFETLVISISAQLNLKQITDLHQMQNQTPKRLFTLRVFYENEPDYEKIIELEGNISLEEAGHEISISFGWDDMLDYSFIIKDKNEYLLEYVSLYNKKPALLKVDAVKLNELSLTVGSSFVLIPTQKKNLALKIVVEKISQCNPYIVYPRIIQQSPLALERESDWEEL